MHFHQAAPLAGSARSTRAFKLNHSVSVIAVASVLGLAGLANSVIAPGIALASDECGDPSANGGAPDLFVCAAGIYPLIEYTDTNGNLTLVLEDAVTTGGISIVGDAGELLTIETTDTQIGLGDLSTINPFGAAIDVFGQGPGVSINLTSTDLGADSATLVSGLAGINAINTSGFIFVRMTEGSVIGTDFAGINAQAAGIVSVQLLGGTTVSGQTAGVQATSTASDVDVTTTGLVVSSAGVGVALNAVGDVTASIGDVDAVAGVGLAAVAGGDADVQVTGNIFGDTAVRVQALGGDVRFALLDGASVESSNAAFYGVGLSATGGGNVFAVIDGNVANGGLSATATSGGVALTGGGDIINTLGLDAVDVITDAGDVFVGLDGDVIGGDRGIRVRTDSGDVVAAVAGTVSGDLVGVALQSATGDLLVDVGANAAVTSSAGDGIFVQSDGDVGVIVAGSVSGGRGIEALGGGAGDIDIEVLVGGVVAAAGGFPSEGILASAFGAGDINIRVDGSVTGGGLFAAANGSGDVTVTGGMAGVITNELVNRPGISALAGAGDVVVDYAGSVTAVDTAINAFSDSGPIGIRTGGALVSGQAGIRAQSNSGNITVISGGSIDTGSAGIQTQTTGGTVISNDAEIRAQDAGIQALSFGGGGITVLGSGDIAGSALGGISAEAQGDVTIDYAGNIGSQADRVEFDGVFGLTDAAAGALSIRTGGDIWADNNGITALSLDVAKIDIEVAGGQIVARRNAIETSSAGGEVGILVRSGSTVIGNDGTAQSVIDMQNIAAGSNTLTIEAGALVRSGDSLSSGLDDNAIRMTGGSAIVNSAGRINGVVDFAGATSAAFINAGSDQNGWHTTGVSVFSDGDDLLGNTGAIFTNADAFGTTLTFGAGDDQFLNSGSLFVGQGAPGAAVLTLAGLETWTTTGLISLADGAANDLVRTGANTTFSAGSVLAVDIAGSSASDLFDTSGVLAIEQGARLSISAGQPLVLYGKYVVAEADGGVTGQFDFADQFVTAFAGLRDGYTATTGFVEFAQLRGLADAGITPNQKETAEGADSLPDGNPLKDALLLLPDDAAAIDAFDELSGEIHPSARTAALEASRMPRDAVLDRLSDDIVGGAAWAKAYAGSGLSDGDYNAARMDRDLTGFVVGADRSLEDSLTIGFAVGAANTDIDVERRNSAGSVETVEGLAYVGARFGDWRVRGGVGYAETSTETRRDIAFPGFAASPTADYDGSLLQGFVEAGYRFAASGGHVEPFANLTAIQVRTDAFVEQGGGEAGLTGEEAREDVLVTTLGLRFETNPMGAFSLGGSTGWRHTSGDVDPVGRHAFPGDAPFTVLGAAQSDDAAFARLEARWKLSPSMSLGLAYDGALGTGGEDHAITGGFKVVF